MPNARARLAPTMSMISAPTMASTIWVSMTAGSRGGDEARRGRRASAAPKQRGQRQAHGGLRESGAQIAERVHRVEREDLLGCRRLVPARSWRLLLAAPTCRCPTDERRDDGQAATDAVERGATDGASFLAPRPTPARSSEARDLPESWLRIFAMKRCANRRARSCRP